MIEPKKVTLAVAFELADINAINYLAGLSKELHFQLEVVHIAVSNARNNPVKEKAILSHIDTINKDNITYLEIKGKDVVKRLNRLCKDNGSDLLALVHYQDGFIQGLFERSATAAALITNIFLLMVIPSEMK